MTHNDQLTTRIRDYLAARRLPTEEERMMGGLCFMVREKMCVGVYQDRLMVRIDPAAEPAALARRGAAPMDFTGRPMRGYLFISRDGWATKADLDYWLALALDFNPRAVSSKTKPRASQVSKKRRARGRK